MIITIDGPAGSGKSTIADKLAEKLNFVHFNAGSVFRGITAHLLETGFDVDSITSYSTMPKLEVYATMINDVQNVFVNGVNHTPILRDNTISTNVAKVSQNAEVQAIAQKCLKRFCNENNTVIEGRGLGSEVLPYAEYKFYLDCAVSERARRRFLEEQSKNTNITLEEIEEQIIERDRLDKERKVTPLVVPEGAIVIDTTNLTIEELTDLMLEKININNLNT